jgi:cephalosporin hydroxylase
MKITRKIPVKTAHSRASTPIERGSEFEVDNWEISTFIVKRLIPLVGVRPYPLNELMLMVGAVAYFKPSHVFEWGTHIGKSARIFFETARRFDIELDVHTVDLPGSVDHVEHPGLARGKMVRGLPDVFLHQGDGLSRSMEIYDQLTEPIKALFFLDGDHDYASVRRELDGILDKVRNPIVLVHDTFYQTPDSGYNVGPFRAVSDSLKDARVNFRRMDTSTGLPGLTLIFPSPQNSMGGSSRGR